jgi:hypothetical protein
MPTRSCKKCGDPLLLKKEYKTCQKCIYLNTLFKMDNNDYKAMLARQGFACAVCQGKACPTGKQFAVDHDHACCPGTRSCGRCVRGLLCHPCNAFLVGMYERLPDDIRDWPRLNAYLGGR